MNKRLFSTLNGLARACANIQSKTDEHCCDIESDYYNVLVYAELMRLTVLECSRVAKLVTKDNRVHDAIESHFGVQ